MKVPLSKCRVEKISSIGVRRPSGSRSSLIEPHIHSAHLPCPVPPAALYPRPPASSRNPANLQCRRLTPRCFSGGRFSLASRSSVSRSWLHYPESRLQRLLNSACPSNCLPDYPSPCLPMRPHSPDSPIDCTYAADAGKCFHIKFTRNNNLFQSSYSINGVALEERGGGAERGGAPRAVIGRSGPAPRALKNLRKNGASARQCLSDSLGGRTPLALETARPRTGGRGREMPALALRDQPLDCSLRLRASTTPTWRDHPHVSGRGDVSGYFNTQMVLDLNGDGKLP
ncbi:unnamed protein product [Pieris brassicae]|uniref:Uncharacterized protein n=1 Tax=Pieris brassicae TaxID=7116 RepID=A0A9P0XBR8_PIEBR|nr:unnamed protein product [Pieris brassicae]